MTNKNKVGIFIRELRTSKGLSQAELGKRLHVTKKAVSRWETGRGLPDSSLLLPLSEILGVTIDEILKGEFTLSSEFDAIEKRKLDEVNAFLRYCAEKRNMINIFVLLAISSIAFFLSICNDARINSDFGYMGACSMGSIHIEQLDLHELSIITGIFMILFIVSLIFAGYRTVLFVKAKNVLRKD